MSLINEIGDGQNKFNLLVMLNDLQSASMNVQITRLTHVLLLILLSIWGYVESLHALFTLLIPAIVGLALLICNPGLKKENKVVAHVVVVLTLLLFIGLFQSRFRVSLKEIQRAFPGSKSC
ncbi:MAG: hypothetical protein AAF600_21265 [Bacteroidota bacterium]